MRILMVGPWRAEAMRRHIDWALEGGAEVCAVDYWSRRDRGRPTSFELAYLSPRQTAALIGAKPNRRSQAASRRAALRLRHIAAHFQPDVIHSYMLNSYTDACLQAGLRPLVVSAWGFLNRWLTGDVTAEDRRWLARLGDSAHTLLVESPNFLPVLPRRPLASVNLLSAPVGIDYGLFHPGYLDEAAAWRFVLDIPPDAVVLLSARGWSKVYGQLQIVQAFAQAYHQFGKPMMLVLRGLGRTKRPERLAQDAVALAAELGVAHAVRWIPNIPYEDLPAVYAVADIVLNYPIADAFPSTLLEAAACGRPIITSDLPAYRNTFVERCCTRVPPNDPAALADAIVALATAGPAAWAAQAEPARQAVLAEYDEATQKQRLWALYERLASPLGLGKGLLST